MPWVMRRRWAVACLGAGLLALGMLAGPVRAADRLEVTASFRSLGYRGLNEPKKDNPSAGILPEYGSWVRNWSETRTSVSLGWRLVDTPYVVFVPGMHLGTAVGRFEAKNAAIGFYEAWETRPALLWGPSATVLLRAAPGQGGFLLARYELFVASASEAREEVASATGSGTPPSMRDASFSWRSHEATLALGYDWGRVVVAAGASLIAFRLDKKLVHHIAPSGATGTALAAILALNSRSAHYGYEPDCRVTPYLSVAFLPIPRLRLEAGLRPASQPDCTLSLTVSF